MYQIIVRDQYLNRIGEITDFQKLEFIPCFNDVGPFMLELPTDSEMAREIIKPKTGIIVKRNNQTLFSGPVTRRNRKWINKEDRIIVSGYDDMIHLLRSPAYPVPNGPPYTSQEYDVRTGKSETIMKQYVDANIGLNARTERRVPKLVTEVDKGLGEIVTGRARFQSLLDLFIPLAISGGNIGFRVVQVGKNLEFQVYEPSDKTKSVFFSPLLGNLLGFDYTLEDPEANYLVAGGGGEGTARTFLERGDSASIAKSGRIESFIDQRNTSDTVELEQAIQEELAQKAEKTSLSITPIDTDSIAFGRDYNLGDKVSIVITQPNEIVDIETLYYFISAYQTVPVSTERVRKIQEKLDVIQDIVREIKITISREGESISPVIGTPDSASMNHPVRSMFDRMRKLRKLISNFERR